MTRRLQKLLIGIAALAALALGGSAFAQAQSSTPSAPEGAGAPDRDKVQSGDQTTPDRGVAASAARKVHHARPHHGRLRPHHGRHHAVRAATSSPSAVDVDTTQSGDQTTPDQPGSAGAEKPGAQSPERPGGAERPGAESAPSNDGPGGHADEPGNANADHQAQGKE